MDRISFNSVIGSCQPPFSARSEIDAGAAKVQDLVLHMKAPNVGALTISIGFWGVPESIAIALYTPKPILIYYTISCRGLGSGGWVFKSRGTLFMQRMGGGPKKFNGVPVPRSPRPSNPEALNPKALKP